MSLAVEFKKNVTTISDEVKFEFHFFEDKSNTNKKNKKKNKKRTKITTDEIETADQPLDPAATTVSEHEIIEDNLIEQTLRPSCNDSVPILAEGIRKLETFPTPSIIIENETADEVTDESSGAIITNKKSKKKKKNKKPVASSTAPDDSIFRNEDKAVMLSSPNINDTARVSDFYHDNQFIDSFQKLNINKKSPGKAKKKNSVAKGPPPLRPPPPPGNTIKSMQCHESTTTTNSPRFISIKDPELTEEERRTRKFGNGINLSVIGPPKAKRVITKWIGGEEGSASNSTTNDNNINTTNMTSNHHHTSPFSFGFRV